MMARVYDFGIDGYRPDWRRGAAEVAFWHGPTLAAAVGRRLTRAWVAWEVERDRCFEYNPVLLDFEGMQVEINHTGADLTSVTVNTIGPAAPIRDPVPGVSLIWSSDRFARLVSLHGQRLWRVDLLRRPPGREVGIGLAFSRMYLTLYNPADWNRLVFGPPDSHFQQNELVRAAPTAASRPLSQISHTGLFKRSTSC